VDSTCGLIFLGTPFGNSKAQYAELALRYSTMLGLPRNATREDLVERSQKLININDAFQKFLRAPDRLPTPIKVICVFETINIGTEIIVPQQLATLPGFEVRSINADHCEMCRFKAYHEPGYKMISSILDLWIKATECDILNSSDVFNTAVMGNTYIGNSFGSQNIGRTSNIRSFFFGRRATAV
jgi:protein SERAC1